MRGKGKKGASACYKFAAWHPGVLKRIPRDLVELFPVVILRTAAVDTKLTTRKEQTLVSPIGLQNLQKQLAECHKGYSHQDADQVRTTGSRVRVINS